MPNEALQDVNTEALLSELERRGWKRLQAPKNRNIEMTIKVAPGREVLLDDRTGFEPA